MAKQLMAEIVSVPACESETGHDEVYVVFDGKRIAKRAGTAYAGTWVSLEPVRSCGERRRVDGDPRHRSSFHSLNEPNEQLAEDEAATPVQLPNGR